MLCTITSVGLQDSARAMTVVKVWYGVEPPESMEGVHQSAMLPSRMTKIGVEKETGTGEV